MTPLPPEIATDDPPEILCPGISDDLPEDHPWRPTDTEDAEWCMGHLVRARKAIEDIEQQAQQWRERIDEWESRATRRHVKTVERMSQYLEGYAEQWRLQDPKRNKTLILPSGDFGSRSTGAQVKAAPDPDAQEELIAWLESYAAEMGMDAAELFRTKKTPIAASLKKVVEPVEIEGEWIPAVQGEVVPGVVVEPPKTTWGVR